MWQNLQVFNADRGGTHEVLIQNVRKLMTPFNQNVAELPTWRILAQAIYMINSLTEVKAVLWLNCTAWVTLRMFVKKRKTYAIWTIDLAHPNCSKNMPLIFPPVTESSSRCKTGQIIDMREERCYSWRAWRSNFKNWTKCKETKAVRNYWRMNFERIKTAQLKANRSTQTMRLDFDQKVKVRMRSLCQCSSKNLSGGIRSLLTVFNTTAERSRHFGRDNSDWW
jgi:hypothetical protein